MYIAFLNKPLYEKSKIDNQVRILPPANETYYPLSNQREHMWPPRAYVATMGLFSESRMPPLGQVVINFSRCLSGVEL